MEIKKEFGSDNSVLTIHLSGRLDAVTAQDLDKALQSSLDGVTDLTFDLAELVYIASAGLRTLLAAYKRMKRQGNMKLKNVNKDVKEVLEMTGFIDFLPIED